MAGMVPKRARHDEEQVTSAKAMVTSSVRAILKDKAVESRYEEIYRAAYNLTLSKHGQWVYQEAEKLVMECVNSISVSLRASTDMATDELFLEYLSAAYDDFKRRMEGVSMVLMYVDRYACVLAFVSMCVYDMHADVLDDLCLICLYIMVSSPICVCEYVCVCVYTCAYAHTHRTHTHTHTYLF
jgi:hypothetical protein